jgi:ribose transport system substrate-binding protein
MLVGLVAVLALLSIGAPAQDKILAIVVKGLDNPFFDLIRQGCEKAQGELSSYRCFYTGPASTLGESDEVRIIDDLLTTGVAAMAISPSNAPAVANVLRRRKPSISVMTIDSDLLAQDRGLRRTYLGTDNYLMGVKLAQYLEALRPNGGTLCLVLGNFAADNINQRAAGTRDTLAGNKGVERLTGQNFWNEIASCPLFTNDRPLKAIQMMSDVLTANKTLDAFVLEGGWPQWAPQAYAQLTDQYMHRIKTKQLALVAADTLPPQIAALKQGRSHAQIGQRPFEMGYRAPLIMRDMVEGRKVEPIYFTGLDECTFESVATCLNR